MKSNAHFSLLLSLLAITMLSGNIGCTDGCLAFGAAGDDSTLEENKTSVLSYLQERDCDSEEFFPYAVVGECDDGDNRVKFLAFSTGFTAERRYFDFDTERTIAISGGGDVVFPPCYGQFYWPRHVNCKNGTITEVLCGTRYEVGDDFPNDD